MGMGGSQSRASLAVWQTSQLAGTPAEAQDGTPGRPDPAARLWAPQVQFKAGSLEGVGWAKDRSGSAPASKYGPLFLPLHASPPLLRLSCSNVLANLFKCLFSF